MPTYTFTCNAELSFDIDAETPEEAKSLAENQVLPGNGYDAGELMHKLQGAYVFVPESMDLELTDTYTESKPAFRHRYSVTTCPDCGSDLTDACAVTIMATNNAGGSIGDAVTCLNANGLLLADEEGYLENGQHSGTTCTKCDRALDEFEVSA